MSNEGAGAGRIIALRRSASGRDAVLTLTDGAQYVVPRADRRSDVWTEVLEARREADLPVYVRFDLMTRALTLLLLPKLRQVARVADEPEGEFLPVTMFRSPAFYRLRLGGRDYEKFYRLLREGRDNQEWLWITNTLDTLEIVDVRRPDVLQPGGWRD